MYATLLEIAVPLILLIVAWRVGTEIAPKLMRFFGVPLEPSAKNEPGDSHASPHNRKVHPLRSEDEDSKRGVVKAR